MPEAPDCLLCNSSRTARTLQDEELYTYYRCSVCKLYFAEPEQQLTPSVEKSRYDQHENHPQDPNYRRFLSQLFRPLVTLLPEKSHGLDYGSGPGPALNLMFEEAGHSVAIYDPFYADKPQRLTQRYDFITVSETAEHFFNPREEFDLLWSLLRPNGYLGIMTLMLQSPEQFEQWHYRKDDTHVVFYQKETFCWLAEYLNAGPPQFHGDRVCILRKRKTEISE